MSGLLEMSTFLSLVNATKVLAELHSSTHELRPQLWVMDTTHFIFPSTFIDTYALHFT